MYKIVNNTMMRTLRTHLRIPQWLPWDNVGTCRAAQLYE